MRIEARQRHDVFRGIAGEIKIPVPTSHGKRENVKFCCTCGHVIRDQTDRLPYKARLIPDEDEDADFSSLAGVLEAFIMAREAGKQEEFLGSSFGETYPQELDLQSIIYDLLTNKMLLSTRSIYECENCGRIFIEKRHEEARLVSYVPEGESRGVLQSQRRDHRVEPLKGM